MNSLVTPVALPAYTRLIVDSRAPLVRMIVNWVLRFFIKRLLKPDVDIQKLRMRQMRIDQKYAHQDPAACVTQVDCNGVTVELELWQNLPHVFQALPALPQAATALNNIVRFVSSHTGWQRQQPITSTN